MYQQEALGLGFDGARWKPNAVKVAVGRINAAPGSTWDEALHDSPQDYLVFKDFIAQKYPKDEKGNRTEWGRQVTKLPPLFPSQVRDRQRSRVDRQTFTSADPC
jgi:hypothetical protein